LRKNETEENASIKKIPKIYLSQTVLGENQSKINLPILFKI